MVSWINALAKTRNHFSRVLTRVFSREDAIDGVSVEELEETLIAADLPPRLVNDLIQELEKSYKGLRVSKKEMLKKLLVNSFKDPVPFDWAGHEKPYTILVAGVNGSGKTTTCAKLAHRVRQAGLVPLLGATDTFRAAGADQLKLWADRVDCDVVAGAPGADAAAVAYDALDAALARKADVLIIDTAGRMHTKQPLMKELQKVKSALSKRLARAPDAVWIVLDAMLGQNAVVQAKMFHEATPLSGAVIAKLDGSSKAGFVFSISRDLGIPIVFAGLGEGEEDLQPFSPVQFVDALFEEETAVQEVK